MGPASFIAASRELAQPLPIAGVLLRLVVLCLSMPVSLAAQVSETASTAAPRAAPTASGGLVLERSIGDVFDRRDSTFRPDRLGDTVRMRGTIATPTRIARINSRWVSALQDERGGVMLADSADKLGSVEPGTQVEIVGTVQTFNGSEELNVLSLTVIGTHLLPAPLLVGPLALHSEALAGRVVRVRGRLRVQERAGAGGWMYLEDEGDRVQLYLPIGVGDSPKFELGIADEGRLVEVDGVAGQYDRTLPYESNYQLIVLDPSAVRTLGVAPISVRRWVAIGLAGLLILVSVGIFVRHQARLRALHHLSFTDPMTGLLNRRGYEHAVQQALDQVRVHRRVVALILLDLDDFKLVNDLHGHLAGDAVLREVARLLRQLVPPEAGMVSRYGGDEFAIVLADTSAEKASALAESIVTGLRTLQVTAPTATAAGPVVLSSGASVGVATTDRAGSQVTAEALLHEADLALYAGKRAGKGRARVARRMA